MSVLVLITGIVLFIGLIIVHELGHFLVARRNGVVAEEFGIFFPPRLYRRITKKGWVFSINALPLGGFVKMKGEHDSDVELGSFGAASVWSKTKIMAAGVFMNLVVGVLLLVLLSVIGLPQIIPNQYDAGKSGTVTHQEVLVNYVEPNSPAARIGLKNEDQIIAVGPVKHLSPISSISDLQKITEQYAGRQVMVTYKNNGTSYTKLTTLQSKAVVLASLKTNNPKGYLGIALTPLTIKRYSLLKAPIEAVGLTIQIIKLTMIGLGHALSGLGRLIAGLVTGNTVARQHGQAIATSQVAGPVAIFVILKDGSVLGYQYMLFIIAVISLTLAIMNFLPIPALDGGRLWLMLASRAVSGGLPMSVALEESINAFGMLLLITLMVLVTIVDIHHFL